MAFAVASAVLSPAQACEFHGPEAFGWHFHDASTEHFEVGSAQPSDPVERSSTQIVEVGSIRLPSDRTSLPAFKSPASEAMKTAQTRVTIGGLMKWRQKPETNVQLMKNEVGAEP